MDYKRQQKGQNDKKVSLRHNFGNLVLEKSIFSNVFDKDIRRVFIYKKAERLAKVIHIITPAFSETPALRNRIDLIAVGLIDSAVLSPIYSQDALARELLALSSVLSIARTSGMLSIMNVNLIEEEVHALLQEIATYEEPHISLDEVPSIAELAKASSSRRVVRSDSRRTVTNIKSNKTVRANKGQNNIKDKRIEAILSIIRVKGRVYIKDISTSIRDVSEKTIQRELTALVSKGILIRNGKRRWTSYELSLNNK